MYPRCSLALALTAIATSPPALVAADPARVAIHGLLGAHARYATGTPRCTPPPVDGAPAAPAPGGAPELPAFSSLDLRADRTWRRPWGTVSGFVDVQNVTGQDNVEDVMVDQGEVHQMRGLPTFPSSAIAVDM